MSTLRTDVLLDEPPADAVSLTPWDSSAVEWLAFIRPANVERLATRWGQCAQVLESAAVIVDAMVGPAWANDIAEDRERTAEHLRELAEKWRDAATMLEDRNGGAR